MYTTLVNIEIWLSLAIAGYFGWIAIHHQFMRQRGFGMIFIGFITLSLADVFSFLQQVPAISPYLPFVNEVAIALFSLIGNVLVFLGLLNWMPLVVELIPPQRQQLQPQDIQLSETQILRQGFDKNSCQEAREMSSIARDIAEKSTSKTTEQVVQKMWFTEKVCQTDKGFTKEKIFQEDSNQEQFRLLPVELQEAHENLEFHLNNTLLAVIEWNAEGRVKHWSPQAERLFGWTAGEMVGKHYSQWQFVYEEDEPDVIALGEKLLRSSQQTQTRQYSSHRNYTKEGLIIHCEWYTSVRFCDAQLVSVLTCAKNVNATEQARKTLQRSEIRWRTIFDHAPIGICVFNAEGYVIKSNIECKKMLGYLELQGQSFLKWTHPDDIKETFRAFRRAKTEKVPVYQLENRYIHKKGSTIWATTRFSLIRDDNRKQRFVVGMIQDISQRKLAEAALREAHENLAFHINNTPLAVIDWDANFRVQRWGANAKQIFGWSANEIMGKHCFDWPFVCEEDRHQVAEIVSQLANATVSHNISFTRNYTKDGKVLSCEWHNSVRLERDKPLSFLSFVQDVTNRERMREALHQSEALHRLLSENAHDLICLHEVEGTYVYLSNTVKHLLGYQPDELIGESPYSLFHPEDCEIIRAVHEKSKVGYLDNLVEYRIRRQDGQYVWFETYFNPITGNNNQTIKLVTSSRDISQRKQHEAALRNSKEQVQQRHFELYQLYEFSREIGYSLRLKEVVNVLYEYLYRLVPSLSCSSLILADEYRGELCVVSRHQLSKPLIDEVRDEIAVILTDLGKPPSLADDIPLSLLKPSETQTPKKEIQNLETKRQMPLLDTPSKDIFTTENIGVLWLGAEAYEAFTDDQLRLCYTLINHLVGALKRIRALLAQEQQRLENLVQYLPTGVVLLDAEQRIILANPIALEFLPIITGTKVNLVFTGPAASVLAPLFEGQVVALFAEPLPINNYVFEFTACPLETGPYMGNYIIIIQDVTERKRMEAELETERASLAWRVEERTAELSKANVKLAKANKLKNEFLANMSHELRTPLNSILGISEILVEEVYGILNEKQLNSLQTVRNSGIHLLSLINDILDLSKIEAGKVELQYEIVSISALCQASLLFIKELARKKRLKVKSQFDGELDSLYADQLRVKQILVNLLSNAVKFTPEEGEIALEVTSDIDEKRVHFSVTDTGIGIAQEDMPRLFRPFEQIDSGLARQYEGTGLGLALVRNLVELHGGCITLESQLGKGSRFTVTLPNRSHEGVKTDTYSELAVLSRPSAPLHIGTSPLILLAEDNQANVETVVDYLRHLGYRVNVAGTGVEVLERLAEERHDLILMDIHMPSMDGLEATRCIRAKTEYKTLPIIALTALTMPGDKERCLKAGVNDYLSKPVTMRDLRRVIEEHM
jgi:PAS domain S-box-containing protein